ncbi:MAG TPA: hypothetical protein VK509_12320, partial [Polyangiales bacterium]|nr:hypothetical protein [Polyangiales bacterium]
AVERLGTRTYADLWQRSGGDLTRVDALLAQLERKRAGVDALEWQRTLDTLRDPHAPAWRQLEEAAGLAARPLANPPLPPAKLPVPESASKAPVAIASEADAATRTLSAVQVELSTAMREQIAKRFGSRKPPPHRIEVLPDAAYEARFASRRATASFVVEGEEAVIYARATARPEDLLDEVAHLQQLADPKLAADVRFLSNETLAGERWAKASASERLDLFTRKLDVEIDAKQRSLLALAADDPARANVIEQLNGLERLRKESGALSPDRLAKMNAGAEALPDYLNDPAWLFTKAREGRAEAAIAAGSAARTDIPKTAAVAERSTAWNADNVESVERVGQPWQERFVISSDLDGRVTADVVLADGSRAITVEGGAGKRVYSVEAGSELIGADARGSLHGKEVKAGAPFAREPAREYRLVEIKLKDQATATLLEEIRTVPRTSKSGVASDPGWVPRGSNATRRGKIAEVAARSDTEGALAARKAAGKIEDFSYVPHQRGGGGFDNVFVEFTRDAKSGHLQARFRVQEVKDYPNRSVPLAEFTAIRDNLKANHLELIESIDRALVGGTRPAGFEHFSVDQLTAMRDAALFPEPHTFRVEVLVTEQTLLGDETHRSASVIRDLRKDIDAHFKYPALDVHTAPTARGRISPESIERAAAATPKPP